MASADSDGFGATLRGPFAQALVRLRRRLAPRCVVCDLEHGEPLCAGCAHDYFAAEVPRCVSCALRLPVAQRESRCGNCNLPCTALKAARVYWILGAIS